MTKQSMRHLLCIALFLLYCTFGCFGGAVVQQLPRKGQSALQTYTVSATKELPDPKNGNEWQPIRIAVYTKFVEDVVKYCKTKVMPPEYEKLKKELESKLEEEEDEENEDLELAHETEDLQKELQFDMLCSGADEMTTVKRNILFTEVLPKAIKLHTDRLKVNPLKEKSKIPIESAEQIKNSCQFFLSLDKAQEIPEVDFVIFASLSDEPKTVKICTKDEQNRPTSAVIRFVPKEINATRQYIRVTAHEIAHGLGFQHKLMKELKMIEKRESDLYSKQTTYIKDLYMVNSSKVVQKLKDHYGCSGEMKGLYLENEGDDKRAPSHWERRIAKDELMSTYIGEPTGMYYSVLTLALFEGMGFYQADLEKAEQKSWGDKSMCDLLEGKEDSKQTKYSITFCKGAEKILHCTSDRFALGICSAEPNRGNIPNDKLPKGYDYVKNGMQTVADDLMDGNTFIRPLKGTACEDGDESLLPGSIISNMSRCLSLETPVEFSVGGNSGNKVKVQGICAKVRCDNDKKVSVLLKGYGENKWHDCEQDKNGNKLEASEFNGGLIKCPKYEEVCIGLLDTEPPIKIKFHNGKTLTEGYDVDPTEAKATQEDQKEERAGKPSGTDILHGQEPVAQPSARHDTDPLPNVEEHVVPNDPSPKSPAIERDPHSALNSLDSAERLESGGKLKNGSSSSRPLEVSGVGDSNSRTQHTDGQQSQEKASDSHSQRSDNNHQHTNERQLQREVSVNVGVKAAQGLTDPVVLPAVSDSTNDRGLQNPKQAPDHPVRSSVDSASGVAGTSAIASQSTGSLGENGVKEDAKVKPSEESQLNEGQPTKPSEDRLSNAKQVQSPNELESQTAEQKETSSEGNKADVHSSNSSTTASQGSTKDVPTVETAQPRKNETTNNTSSSTDVQERNNASTAEKEPITEEKNKGSTANQVEDLANQLVTVGEKNADSSIITSYIGGCLIALLVCVVGFVMIP